MTKENKLIKKIKIKIHALSLFLIMMLACFCLSPCSGCESFSSLEAQYKGFKIKITPLKEERLEKEIQVSFKTPAALDDWCNFYIKPHKRLVCNN